MTTRYITDIPNYPAPHLPYSHAVVANGFVFVSGQIAVKPRGGQMEIVGTTMQEQTRQAFLNVQAILPASGSSLDRIVKVTVLLARPVPGDERGLRGVLSRAEAGALGGAPGRRDAGRAGVD